MTHDKLLGRIEEQAVLRAGSLADYEAGLLTRTSERAIARQMAKINWMKRQLSAWNALRAVVELHKPIEPVAPVETHDDYWYGLCDDCLKTYPCSTIQAIEKELR